MFCLLFKILVKFAERKSWRGNGKKTKVKEEKRGNILIDFFGK